MKNEKLKKISLEALDKVNNFFLKRYKFEEMDKKIEEFIISELKKEIQDVKIVSEERGIVILGTPNKTIFIDPIDGSGNFFRGIPVYAVSIALCEGNLEKVSVEDIKYSIIASSLGLFEAIKDKGFKRDGKESLAKEKVSFDTALLRSKISKRYRMFGASAVELGLLSYGSLDGFIELNGLKIVDLVPAMLMLKETNCYFGDAKGNEIILKVNEDIKGTLNTFVAARTKSLYEEIIQKIK